MSTSRVRVRERKPTAMSWIERAIILLIVLSAVGVAAFIWIVGHFVTKYW